MEILVGIYIFIGLCSFAGLAAARPIKDFWDGIFTAILGGVFWPFMLLTKLFARLYE